LNFAIIAVVILGSVAQLLLLGTYHRVKPWSRVILRTVIVQVMAVLAATVLSLNWRLPFPAVYGVLPMPFVLTEVFVVLWYLMQRRSGSAPAEDD
jgi:hypothetical protein